MDLASIVLEKQNSYENELLNLDRYTQTKNIFNKNKSTSYTLLLMVHSWVDSHQYTD